MAKKRKQPPSPGTPLPGGTQTALPKKAKLSSAKKSPKVALVPEPLPELLPSLTKVNRPESLAVDKAKATGASQNGAGGFRNKEKVLVLSSRGITFRFRHLMEDLMLLLPHSKKEVKMENSKENRASMLNEMADLKGCSSCIFFEAKKKKDLYMWISKTPSGPSAKFLVSAVHTMAELKLTGNHLRGARPLLTFSPAFSSSPHLQLLQEMFVQILGTPKEHRKSKPFFDHVYALSVVDNHIWFRNYQIVLPVMGVSKPDKAMLEKMTLVEVGPRFCMNPIKIFGGSFGGITLYENPLYVSPNEVRSQQKRAKAGKYAMKVKAKVRRKQHRSANPTEEDELADMWKD